jgi:outer membrane cobalamin receptor
VGVGDTATRALVLLDGIPLNGGFFGNVFWNRVPKEMIERVEIVRGASSSLYGSYAMGGVVNIVTRVPTERSGTLDAAYGQQNTVASNPWYSDAFADRRPPSASTATSTRPTASIDTWTAPPSRADRARSSTTSRGAANSSFRRG